MQYTKEDISIIINALVGSTVVVKDAPVILSLIEKSQTILEGMITDVQVSDEVPTKEADEVPLEATTE